MLQTGFNISFNESHQDTRIAAAVSQHFSQSRLMTIAIAFLTFHYISQYLITLH